MSEIKTLAQLDPVEALQELGFQHPAKLPRMQRVINHTLAALPSQWNDHLQHKRVAAININPTEPEITTYIDTSIRLMNKRSYEGAAIEAHHAIYAASKLSNPGPHLYNIGQALIDAYARSYAYEDIVDTSDEASQRFEEALGVILLYSRGSLGTKDIVRARMGAAIEKQTKHSGEEHLRAAIQAQVRKKMSDPTWANDYAAFLARPKDGLSLLEAIAYIDERYRLLGDIQRGLIPFENHLRTLGMRPGNVFEHSDPNLGDIHVHVQKEEWKEAYQALRSEDTGIISDYGDDAPSELSFPAVASPSSSSAASEGGIGLPPLFSPTRSTHSDDSFGGSGRSSVALSERALHTPELSSAHSHVGSESDEDEVSPEEGIRQLQALLEADDQLDDEAPAKMNPRARVNIQLEIRKLRQRQGIRVMQQPDPRPLELPEDMDDMPVDHCDYGAVHRAELEQTLLDAREQAVKQAKLSDLREELKIQRRLLNNFLTQQSASLVPAVFNDDIHQAERQIETLRGQIYSLELELGMRQPPSRQELALQRARGAASGAARLGGRVLGAGVHVVESATGAMADAASSATSMLPSYDDVREGVREFFDPDLRDARRECVWAEDPRGSGAEALEEDNSDDDTSSVASGDLGILVDSSMAGRPQPDSPPPSLRSAVTDSSGSEGDSSSDSDDDSVADGQVLGVQ